MVLRLNDPARTPANVAAILIPGDAPRLCITLGPVPVAGSPIVVTGVPGTYWVRARARNTCGASPSTADVLVVIG